MCTLGCLLFVTLSVAALSLGPSRGHGWIFVNNEEGFKKKPRLVEWDGTSVVVHRADGSTGSAAYDSSSSTLSGDFKTFMDWMYDHRKTDYAVIAVRPSGFGTLGALLNEFKNRNIDYGYEPVEDQNRIVLLQGDKPQ